MYKVVAFLSVTLIILAQCFVSFAAEERLNYLNIGVKKRISLSSSKWKFMPIKGRRFDSCQRVWLYVGLVLVLIKGK
jgi:hypothetical protein